jgi:hypothetical protein
MMYAMPASCCLLSIRYYCTDVALTLHASQTMSITSLLPPVSFCAVFHRTSEELSQPHSMQDTYPTTGHTAASWCPYGEISPGHNLLAGRALRCTCVCII